MLSAGVLIAAARLRIPDRGMDCRIKSGNDDSKQNHFATFFI
jgi:hypothetical protein